MVAVLVAFDGDSQPEKKPLQQTRRTEIGAFIAWEYFGRMDAKRV